jgi:uncharacterized membrane protein SpoIIM required for sporulation
MIPRAAEATISTRRFREQREPDWRRLEAIVTQAERKSVRALDDADLLALPVLYRAALSALSVARETSLDKALVAYLEALCARAYFFVYGVRVPARERFTRFLAQDWPEAVRALWRETLLMLALTIAGAWATWVLVRQDPSWFYAVIPEGLAGGRDPSASTAALRAVLYDGGGKDFLATFATFLFTHNAQIAILSFALGFAFGVPSALLIVYNGCMLGAFFALYVPRGLGWQLGGWLSIHGTTEIFAIIIAGAAGLRIGRAVAFPGRLTRLASATAAGRAAATAMAGVVIMLLIAGLLEGVGRQMINNDIARYAIGGAMLLFWCLYYYLPRRRAAHG